MQGHMCRIATLEGKSPPGKNRESSCKGYTKWLSCLDMIHTRAIWLILRVREAGIRLKKAGKTDDNAITT